MPTARIKFGDGEAVLTHQDGWKAGDQPPPDHDYLGWHAWAEVQHKAGLRQKQCGKCSLWRFPQEMSDKVTTHQAYRDKKGTKPVTLKSHICNRCNSGSEQ